MIKYFLIGWLFAAAFWAYSINWIFDAINYYGAGTFLSGTITFLLIAYLSVYFGIFLVAINYFKDHQFKFLIIPSVFFLLEWLRSWVISGFPWLNLGILSASLWGLLPVVGVAGTSFLMILVMALLLERNKKIINRATASLILLLLFFGPGHYQEGGKEKLKITVLQPLDTNMTEIIQMTNDAESDLVVWPEAVTVYDKNISQSIPQKEVIGGFFRKENTNFYTSAINIKTGHFHDKRNLVPFGEFQPFGNLLESFNDFFNIPNSSLSRGDLNQIKVDWSALICWELAFNNTFTDRVRGTKYIIHMSNDKWYGESMPVQHLQHAKARAVESNKWVARATLDGISQIISPRSNESSKILDRGEKGSITHEITLNEVDTFYLKYGDVPLLIISALSLIFGMHTRKNEK
ncbi:MAG: apolipoprotein N-acyltransferase [Gammaproteobacteria bacterium TMED112]|nr:MAG: apolipoprotein N-acyltransferase [Gammaproteobacteria bacterium TMED112]